MLLDRGYDLDIWFGCWIDWKLISDLLNWYWYWYKMFDDCWYDIINDILWVVE